ncbi:hypothetical protein WME91_01845 [Sorangium sp. So ce269]
MEDGSPFSEGEIGEASQGLGAAFSVNDVEEVERGDGYLVARLEVPYVVPGTGGGVDPSYYGLCGIKEIGGYFGDEGTSARIVVEPTPPHRYVAETVRRPGAVRPRLTLTCVYLSELTGLPPSAEAYSYTKERSSTSPPGFMPIGTACPWTGLSGQFNARSATPGMFDSAEASAVYHDSLNGHLLVADPIDGAAPITSHALCVNYASSHGWRYFSSVGGYLLGDDGLREWYDISPSREWCFIDRITSYEDMQSSGQPWRVELGAAMVPRRPWQGYYLQEEPEGWPYYVDGAFQCLSVAQR